MKIYKYVTVLLAVLAMSATFFSCDRDNDITGEPMADHTQGNKQDYWIDFSRCIACRSERHRPEGDEAHVCL